MPSSGRALLVFMHLGECGRDTQGQPEAVQVRTPTYTGAGYSASKKVLAGRGRFHLEGSSPRGDATTPGSWAADNTPSLGHRVSFLGDPLTLPPAQPPAAMMGRSLLWGDGPTCWPQGKGKGAPKGPLSGSRERARPPILFTPRVGGTPPALRAARPAPRIHLLPQQHQVRCRAGHQELGNSPRGQARRQGFCRRGVHRASPGQADLLP